jgi:hypothetical protein
MTTSKKSYADRAAAAPTELHKNFAAWIKEQTGVDVDLKSLQLACSMRMDFQRSEANQADLQARKEAAAKKAAAEKAARIAKAKAQLAKLQAEIDADSAGSDPAPAKKAPAKKTPAAAQS